MEYNILDFGARQENKNNAEFIQKAIDTCNQAGGGKVVIPTGTFISGSIVLKSNVELYLENGAILKASSNMMDFNLFNKEIDYDETLQVPSYQKCDYDGSPYLFFIYGENAENVQITGFGKIDGNEEIFYGETNQYQIDGRFYPRMPLIYLVNITHLSILNITCQRSAFWTVHLVGCNDVLIDGIRILNNLRLANCDGIDPDHCKDVRIANCFIQCADDGIVIKNTAGNQKYGISSNISVDNCTIISTSGAIKFGTETCSDFRNIIFNNINIHSSNRGITIQLRDQGNIENVSFNNINIDNRAFKEKMWWGRGEPIAITAVKREETTNIGRIYNMTFNNINCDSESGILLYGENISGKYNIENVTFNNIYIKMHQKSKWSKNYKDIRPTYHYPNMIEHLVNVIYARNLENVTFSNFKFDIDKEYVKGNIGELYDVKDVNNFNVNPK